MNKINLQVITAVFGAIIGFGTIFEIHFGNIHPSTVLPFMLIAMTLLSISIVIGLQEKKKENK